MARVPTYDQPQVAEQALPGARRESVASPGLIGSAADSEVALGTAATNAGTGITAVAYHMQQKDNLRQVQDATVDYGKRLQDFQIKAQEERIGAAAKGLVTDFSDWHTKQMAEIATKLGNDAQREAFTVMARKSGLATRHNIATFEIGETRKANIAAFEGSVANNINLGATSVTPEATATFKDNVVADTKAFAAASNLPPEAEQAMLTKNLTEFHAQKIQQLARVDPAAATSYFEANKAEIAGSRQAEIGDFAQKATAEKMGTDAAGEIWAKVGPTKGLDVMEEAARERFKNDPFTLKATIASLRERTQAFDKGNAERVDNVAAAVNMAVMKGASVTQIRAMPEFIALSSMGGAGAKMALSISDHAENKAYTATLRATANEARQQQILQRRGMAAYLDYSNPDKLASMSEAQIVNLLPTLGNDLTSHLMTQKRGLVKTTDKIVEARMDQQDFDHIANEVGLKPFANVKTEDQKAALGQLKFSIEQQIDAAQQAKGKALTRVEKMQIMRSAMDNKVLVDEWGTDPSKPVMLLKPEEMTKAYVTVEGREIKLSSIPPADRTAIITSRRKHGLPVTEQAIAEMWVRKNKPATAAP